MKKIDEDGNVRYYNENNQLHRTDGPAVEWIDGEKLWYINGQLHRADGPAREYADGCKEWWINGQCHREDGPAIEFANGSKYWYINGERLTQLEFNQLKYQPTTNDFSEGF